ncbi:hypothetical protein SCLCIDRAFT_19800 [Scleroderma citrinum Foug A]|uniref:Uncharacterized protein n=1 Tax=Scleroderma citrinum Foug A TaxID=1036808 RepID=A0A0C3A663_9AGAM|nr:hypothetical protein SCLCIDRAFT_19800 [Scleroderma citrinum Foug A]
MAPMGIAGTQLTRKERMYPFALVTTLFFTWGFSYGVRSLSYSLSKLNNPH